MTVKRLHGAERPIHPQGLTGLQGLVPEKDIVNTENFHPDDVHRGCEDCHLADPAHRALAPVAALSFVVVAESELWQTFLQRQKRSGERGSALRES